jgi:hypothetical protein
MISRPSREQTCIRRNPLRDAVESEYQDLLQLARKLAHF